jgi:hypothetical protein
MRWDIFAAVVALAGIPFTLSSAALWLLRIVTQRLMRMIFPGGSTCDRLQWSDIPSGPLHAYLNKEALQESDYYGCCGPYEETLTHDEEQCFASTIGKVFQNAWISAQRRDQRVFKPYQLDPRKTYIRTDAKTLRAYALMPHEDCCSQYGGKPVISFKDMIGDLTAHLSASRAQLPDVTKEEVEAVLDGYSPFYLEKIYISENSYVTTTILRFEDITRSGWIVAVGLDYYNSAPLWTHNMGSSKIKDNSVSQRQTRSTSISWKITTIASAVKRFGHALGNV